MNDSPDLENEADEMGKRAASGQVIERGFYGIGTTNTQSVQLKTNSISFGGNELINSVLSGSLTCKIGDTSRVVVIIQQALADAGFLNVSEVSGNFDSATETAVINFQSASGLTGKDIDGVVGKDTMSLLDTYFSKHTIEAKLGTSTDKADPMKGTKYQKWVLTENRKMLNGWLPLLGLGMFAPPSF